jgi:hypothetical protein
LPPRQRKREASIEISFWTIRLGATMSELEWLDRFLRTAEDLVGLLAAVTGG